MSDPVVGTVHGLLEALTSGARNIAITGSLRDVPLLELAPGQALCGTSLDAGLQFQHGSDGVTLSADNTIRGLALHADPNRRCIRMTDTPSRPMGGHFEFTDLTVTGQIQCLFDDRTAAAELQFRNVKILGADLRPRAERVHGNGVSCLQGALTIWNRAIAPTRISVSLDGIGIGTPVQPGAIGSGIFIAGSGKPQGGTVRIDKALLQAISVDSGLPDGETATICGGVFILPGAHAARIHCIGLQQSHGPNAVPLDNWGTVGTWLVDGDVVTYGRNAPALVNAGNLGLMSIGGQLETHGDGARGCAIYGPVRELRIRSLRTRGKAATGVHICNSLELLTVIEGIKIQGGPGLTMVKGSLESAHADGVHIAVGGRLAAAEVAYIALADLAAQGFRRDDLKPQGRPSVPEHPKAPVTS